MNIEQLKDFCRSLAGATERLVAPPSNVLVYAVGNKTFAYFKTSEPEQWRFSFRVTPERFVELTDVPGVKPARYMGRFRWVTIVDVASFPADYLVELIQWSHENAISKLSRAQRKALNLDHKQPQQ
ncbi:MAG TPA: MmcQ/YjbR family DNA-binding protein [Rhodocyclaceae bacterium]|nr:MmcQ/YjbR family DNA-binding protein [Rhodocyclaceae bacterium]